MKDYIGRYVKRFESGDLSCFAFGRCGDDWGLSCGTNQRILRYGIAIGFLKTHFPENELVKKLYFNYDMPDLAINYWPGEQYCSSPADLKAAWLSCIEEVGKEEFERIEHEDILENYYSVAKEELNGLFDVEKNRAFQEMTFAGSIFCGAVTYANRIKNILHTYQNDEQFFDTIYDTLYKEYPWERWADAKHTSYLPNSERETLRPLLKKAAIKEGECNMRILLDPGHYSDWYNQSTTKYKEYYESRFTWKFTNMLKTALEKFGVTVGLTRQKDQDVGLVDRGKMAQGYDLFLSLHSNAVGNRVDEKTDYAVAYIMLDDGDKLTTYDNISRELGLKLAQCVKITMNLNQDGIIQTRQMEYDRNGNGKLDAEDEYYGVLYGARQVKTPGIILEHSFHTNTRSTQWLLNDSNLQKMADAEAQTIALYFGLREKAKMTAFWLCDGTLEITYVGADGVNLHSGLKMVSTNVVGVLHKGEKRRVVQGIQMSDGQNWYRLESGEYITANKNYVAYTENNQKKKVGKVTGIAANDVLNVRDFPNSYSGNVTRTLKEGNLVQVIGECYNNGMQWYLVDQGNAPAKFSGFVAARYVE